MKVFNNQKKEKALIESYNNLLRNWEVEYREVDLHTQYGITHCIITGNPANPPLVMLHGVGDNSAVMWILNIKGLSQYFYCIAIDTLGGPGKSVPNDNYDKHFRQVEWLKEVLAKLNLEKTNMIGVSNGACMAYNFTVKASNLVNKVVCIEGGMIIKPYQAMFRTLMLMFPEILFPTEKNMKKIIYKMAPPNSKIFETNPAIVDHIVLVMKSHNQKAMFVHKLEKYNEQEGRSQGDKLYFLMGDYLMDRRKDFIDLLKSGGYQYKIINDASHALNQEQPTVTNEEIINFILHSGTGAQ